MFEVVVLNHFQVGRFGTTIHEHLFDAPAIFAALIGLRGDLIDANRLLDNVELLFRKPKQFGHFFMGGRSAQLVGELVGGTSPFGEQLDHVGGDADRLGSIDQSIV